MFKKTVSICTAIVMSLGVASCTAPTGNTNDGPTKISMLFLEPGNSPYREDWLAIQEIQKKHNVKLDLQVVPGKDYVQKRSIVFASDDIPDLVVNCWPLDISQYAQAGLLLPVSDYLEKMPNLKKVISDWKLEDTIENISEMDGKFYVLPDLRKKLGGTQTFAIREDIFKKHNIPEPQTYEDLFNVLVQIKKLYPQTLGIGELYMGQHIMSFMAEAFGTNGGFSLPAGYSYRFDTKEWYYAPTSNENKAMLTYLNKLYKNGALDPEAFTQDNNQYDSKVLNSKYMIFPSDGPSNAKSTTIKLNKAGNTEAKVKALYPLEGPAGRKVKPSSRNQGGMGMSAKVAKRKDLDKVLKFCDDMYYTQESAILASFGVEGVTYDKKDGLYVMKPDIRTGANPGGTVEMNKQYGFGLMGLTSLVPDIIPEEIKKTKDDPDQHAFGKYIQDNGMTNEDDPIVKLTAKQKDRVKLLTTTLNDYANQMKMKYIFGQESLDNWDNFVKECEKKGSKELVEIITTAWKENHKKK